MGASLRTGIVGYLGVLWLAGCGLVIDATPPPDGAAGRGEAGTDGGRFDGAPDGRPTDGGGAETGVGGDGSTDGAPDAPRACSDDMDCSDGLRCTKDKCSSGRCVHQPENDQCMSGFICRVGEGCVRSGECVRDEDCPDSTDPCRRFVCDASAGRCVEQVAPEGYVVATDVSDADVCICRHGTGLGDGSVCGDGIACPAISETECRYLVVTWGGTPTCGLWDAGEDTSCTPLVSGPCVAGGRCDGMGNCQAVPVVCPAGRVCDASTGCGECSDVSECAAPPPSYGDCEPKLDMTCGGTQQVTTRVPQCVGSACTFTEAVDVRECELGSGEPCGVVYDTYCEAQNEGCGQGKLHLVKESYECTDTGICVGSDMNDQVVGSCPPARAEGDVCGEPSVSSVGGCMAASTCALRGLQEVRVTPKVCIGGDCRDGTPYTEFVPCVRDTDGDACDDGDACTIEDTCLGGSCVATARKVCTDGAMCCPDTGECARMCIGVSPGGGR